MSAVQRAYSTDVMDFALLTLSHSLIDDFLTRDTKSTIVTAFKGLSFLKKYSFLLSVFSNSVTRAALYDSEH